MALSSISMHALRVLVIFSVIASGLTAVAPAQEKPTVQFLAFPKQTRPEPVEMLVGKDKTIEVPTPGNELSPAFETPALESIVVGKTVVNDEGETVFEVYGKAKSLGTSKQIILLLRKGAQNSDGFVVLPINGELRDFKGGSYLFINASKLNVGGIIGDQKFALEPGQRRLLNPSPDHENGICQVTLSYQLEEKWKKFKDTRWPANKRYRSLIFFHQNPKSGRLGVSPIVDMLPYPGSDSD